MTTEKGEANSEQLLEERAFWKQAFAAKPRTIIAPESLERAKRKSAAAGQRQKPGSTGSLRGMIFTPTPPTRWSS